MDEHKLYEIALGLVPGVGCKLAKQLASYCHSAENVFSRSKGQLLKIPGIGEQTAASIVLFRNYHLAEKILADASQNGIKVVSFTDKEYPKRMRRLNDAPFVLFMKGEADLNAPKTISIVGTRKATPYGKRLCEKIISGLEKYKPLIVSGMAYGIDIAAHKAALEAGLPTLGVMATGLDRIYPPAHTDTGHKMLQQGGLLTEYAFGVFPDAKNFPERNRIIAGLADAVLVVEAAAKGGALITSSLANSYDVEVFACPGNAGAPYSEGCNQLIKSNKAYLAESAEDIAYIMNWDAEGESKTVNTQAKIWALDLNEKETVLIEMLRLHETTIDELSWQSRIPVNEVASLLLGLEFKGAIKGMPGKKFALA